MLIFNRYLEPELNQALDNFVDAIGLADEPLENPNDQGNKVMLVEQAII